MNPGYLLESQTKLGLAFLKRYWTIGLKLIKKLCTDIPSFTQFLSNTVFPFPKHFFLGTLYKPKLWKNNYHNLNIEDYFKYFALCLKSILCFFLTFSFKFHKCMNNSFPSNELWKILKRSCSKRNLKVCLNSTCFIGTECCSQNFQISANISPIITLKH